MLGPAFEDDFFDRKAIAKDSSGHLRVQRRAVGEFANLLSEEFLALRLPGSDILRRLDLFVGRLPLGQRSRCRLSISPRGTPLIFSGKI